MSDFYFLFFFPFRFLFYRPLLETCRACLRSDCKGRIYLSFQYHNKAPDAFLKMAYTEYGFKVCKWQYCPWSMIVYNGIVTFLRLSSCVCVLKLLFIRWVSVIEFSQLCSVSIYPLLLNWQLSSTDLFVFFSFLRQLKRIARIQLQWTGLVDVDYEPDMREEADGIGYIRGPVYIYEMY